MEKIFNETDEVDALELMQRNNVKLIILPELKNRVNPNWVMPTCNIEDYAPVAFFYKNGTIELDFLSEEKGDFLSEYDDLAIEIPYPFMDGYKPTPKDFEELGFVVLFE